MNRAYTVLQIYLTLLLALSAAVLSSQPVQQALEKRQSRPLSEVIDEFVASVGTPLSAITD